MCNHGFLEKDEEQPELLTMHRIEKFIDNQHCENKEMLRDIQEELWEGEQVDSYSELPLGYAVDILERLGDEFSLAIKAFIRDLEIEAEGEKDD